MNYGIFAMNYGINAMNEYANHRLLRARISNILRKSWTMVP
jgi:hypothetical protein